MSYIIKPVVCDYAVINDNTGKIVCICNCKENAEIIADILNGDSNRECSYSYDRYPSAKYIIIKKYEED